MTTLILIIITTIVALALLLLICAKRTISELKRQFKEAESYALHLQKENKKLMKEKEWWKNYCEKYIEYLKSIDPDASIGYKKLF